MSQQINLYQPMFRKQRRVLCASAMLQTLAIVVCGFMSLYAYGLSQVHLLGEEVEGLHQQRDDARARLVGLEQQVPVRAESLDIIERVRLLRLEVNQRRQLLAALSTRVAAEQDGFASFLAGLARQRIEGLWLTGIHISEGGQRLSIRGRALRPELVPVLVRQLGREPSFDGLAFGALNIDRREPSSPVDFQLQTMRMEDES